MARPVDEKLVVMKLDNSDFRKKATETTGLFDALKNAMNKIPGVNLGKSVKEMKDLGDNTDKVKMAPLTSAVEAVAGKFTALGIIGVTALQNITNRAVDTGLALAKSLTFEQVNAGFSEYELKMKSIGTIMSNTEWAGTTLTDVKRVLEDLNTYADETIYNFAQMTDNIGRFTAAGVKIDDAAIAIKGLSNLAAVSGSDVNQLNTAMYQMSQAMAAGKLNLMDWNSMVNAGMGGKKTQDALVATAKAMGKTVDMSDGFRNSIEQGWLTSEVFLETLKKFGDDASMTEAATAVRTFSGAMDTLKESIGSGWGTTFENIFGDYEEATVLWTNVSEAVGTIVSKSAEARNKFVKGVADKGGFQNIFEGLGNIGKATLQVFSALRNGFQKVFPPATVNSVVELTERFKSFTETLFVMPGRFKQISTISQGFFAMFSTGWIIIKKVGEALLNLIPSGTGNGIMGLLEKLANFSIALNRSMKDGNALTFSLDWLGNSLGKVGSIFGAIGGAAIAFGGIIKNNVIVAFNWLAKVLQPVASYLKELFSGFGATDAVGGGVLLGLIVIVKKLSGVFDDFMDKGGGILDSIKDVFDGVGDAISSFTSQIKYNNLLKIAVALGILAISLKVLESLDTTDIVEGLAALAGSLAVMMSGMGLMEKFNITGGIKATFTLIALATAVTIMAVALRTISSLSLDEIGRGMLGLTGIVAALSLGVIAMSKLGGKMGTSSLQLIALATAILILVQALKQLSGMEIGDLGVAMGALTIMFAQIALFLKVVDKTKFRVTSALGIVAIAGAINLMVVAIKQIADVDVNSLVKGLAVITILLAEIALFSKVASGGKLAIAGVGLVLIAASLNALMIPLKIMAGMSWVELAKGLGGMTVALIAMAAAAALMSGGIVGAAGILLMATALTVLAVPIKIFANMTWGEMLKAFVGLAVGLTGLALAAVLLTPAIPSMLGFAAALLGMGAAMLIAGAGVALFGIGLAALATVTVGAVASIIATLGLLLKGLADLIPAAIGFINKLIVAILQLLIDVTPKLLEALVVILVSLLQALVEFVPKFVEYGLEIVVGIINGIASGLGALIGAGVNLIVSFIYGLRDAVRDQGPLLVDAIMSLLGEIVILFIKTGIAIINTLFGWIPGVKDATSSIGKTAEKYIRDNFGVKDVANDKSKEFTKTLDGNKGSFEKAGKGIGGAVEIGVEGIDYSAIGSGIASGIAKGIKNGMKDVAKAAKNLAVNAYESAKDWLKINSPSKRTMKTGESFSEGFGTGIDNGVKDVEASAVGLAKSANNSFNKFIEKFNPDIEIDNLLTFRAVVDYEGFDPGQANLPVDIVPDTSYAAYMVARADANNRQNGYNNNETTTDQSTTTNEYNYNVNVTTDSGDIPKSKLRKLAQEIQSEIKNIDDRRRMSRGEEVVF